VLASGSQFAHCFDDGVSRTAWLGQDQWNAMNPNYAARLVMERYGDMPGMDADDDPEFW